MVDRKLRRPNMATRAPLAPPPLAKGRSPSARRRVGINMSCHARSYPCDTQGSPPGALTRADLPFQGEVEQVARASSKPTSEAMSPPLPLGLARQVDGGDLLELDGAVLHQVAERRVGRARHLGAIEAHRERRTVVGLGPGRRDAHALHAGRHPVLLLVKALLDVGPRDAA